MVPCATVCRDTTLLSRLAKIAAATCAALLTAALPAAASFPADPTATARGRGVLVVAAGDIACSPDDKPTPSSCQQGATAQLVRRIDPAAVLTLGDTQYEQGELADYRTSYAKTWGKLRPRTYPVPGNHEYDTSGAAGYYHYFRHRQPGPHGWYSYRLGSWRLYALNSECDQVSCAVEEAWLRAQLRQRPGGCSLMYMHQPRFSSGKTHGGTPMVEGLWRVAYRHGVDVALSGHEHNYERFGRLNQLGQTVADGIASFVVGTGGKGLYPIGTLEPGSKAHYDNGFGVLALRLGRGSYGWRFQTIRGDVKDHGSSRC